MASLLSVIEDLIPKVKIDSPLPYTNVLHNYASYNYIFTLSVGTAEMVNDPTVYRSGKSTGRIILKSGSGDPNNRVSLGEYGAFDFFMDDVVIGTTGFNEGNGNTVTTSINFKIFEPYSMGLFFSSLKIAAEEAGFKNYVECPMLLKIEFVGHVSPADLGVNADKLSPIEKTTKYLMIRILKMDLSVNEGGTTYDVEAVAHNEIGHSKTFSEVKTDIKIKGKTVSELLQTGENSLQSILNQRLVQQAQKDNRIPDQIVILFPKDPTTQSTATGGDTATANPNDSKPQNILEKLKVHPVDAGGIKVLRQNPEDINQYGTASMGFKAYSGVKTPFAQDNFVYDTDTHLYKRGNLSLSLSDGSGEMTFAQGGNITNIINEVIMMSEYGQTALMAEQIEQGRGKIMWWSIDVQTYVLDTDYNMFDTGSKPLLVVYRIVPYKVHASPFLHPGMADPNVDELRKNVVKQYSYIYTGKNVDIRKFDIAFNSSVYQALYAVDKTADEKLKHNDSTLVEQPAPSTNTPTNEKPSFFDSFFDKKKLVEATDEVIKRVKTDAISTMQSLKGGARNDTELTKKVKMANDIILNGKDMLTPTIEIAGDPYFLSDSGVGNYIAQESDKENINADHNMNIRNGEVDIIVAFNTPYDIDGGTGTYSFGDIKPLTQFSGVFKLLQVESNFSKGVFTQTLTVVRRPGQYAKTESNGTVTIQKTNT